jgi:hypothetical protein
MEIRKVDDRVRITDEWQKTEDKRPSQTLPEGED